MLGKGIVALHGANVCYEALARIAHLVCEHFS